MKPLIEGLSSTSEGALAIDEQFQITSWNRAAEELLGYPAEQVIGRPCYEVLAGSDSSGRAICQRHCRIALAAMRGEALPNLDVNVLTDEDEDRWLNLTSFALPTASGRQIVHTFRDVTEAMNQERFVEQVVAAARRLKNGSNGNGASAARAAPDPHPDALSPRERQVLQLLAQGLGTQAIAGALTISPATVRNHIQQVLEKLGVHTRLEAVAHAFRNGLVRPDADRAVKLKK